jgi:DNA-binding CsgD family transcriptional regulator
VGERDDLEGSSVDEVREGPVIADLRRALETRSLIGQAMGILMERLDIDAERAFVVLQHISATENTKLLEVAEGLVRTRRLGNEDVRPTDVATPTVDPGLSPREMQVMRLIASGSTNDEIAQQLFLGINTIKTYIRTAYRKVGVSRRSQAIIWGREHGLVDADAAENPSRIW